MKTVFKGKTIKTSTFACSINGQKRLKITRPYVNLYVRVVDICPCKCGFCLYAGSAGHANHASKHFDHEKFREVYAEILKTFYVNKVAITGGEPTLRPETVERVIRDVSKASPKVAITINTNGHNLKSLDKKPILSKIHDIALSVHEYSDSQNDVVFGSRHHAKMSDIAEFSAKDKIHLRCNLIQGFIDSPKEVAKYIEKFSDMGITDFGFVTLWGDTGWAINKFVGYEEAGLLNLPNSRLVEGRSNGRGCTCRNLIAYTEKGRLVRYYTREDNSDHSEPSNSLVYDIDTLLTGFGGETIC